VNARIKDHVNQRILKHKFNTHDILYSMYTLIAGSVESSRICMMILSEGQESSHAAPIDS